MAEVIQTAWKPQLTSLALKKKKQIEENYTTETNYTICRET